MATYDSSRKIGKVLVNRQNGTEIAAPRSASQLRVVRKAALKAANATTADGHPDRTDHEISLGPPSRLVSPKLTLFRAATHLRPRTV